MDRIKGFGKEFTSYLEILDGKNNGKIFTSNNLGVVIGVLARFLC